MVRPEPKPGAGCASVSQGFQKRILEEPVLVMSFLGPGIREQQKDLVHSRPGRQGRQGLMGLGLQKVKARDPGSERLALRTVHTIRDQIDSDANDVRAGFGITRKVVSMPAANLQGEALTTLQKSGKRLRKLSPPLRNSLQHPIRKVRVQGQFWVFGPIRHPPTQGQIRSARQYADFGGSTRCRAVRIMISKSNQMDQPRM